MYLPVFYRGDLKFCAEDPGKMISRVVSDDLEMRAATLEQISHMGYLPFKAEKLIQGGGVDIRINSQSFFLKND